MKVRAASQDAAVGEQRPSAFRFPLFFEGRQKQVASGG
jgi:hypothetical protein